jgi:glycosyltransferase involved in cell wall biosynthesis
VSAWQPAILHSNGIKTHVLGAWVRGRAPLVWHVHDYLSLRRLSPKILRAHRRRAALVVANSHSVAEDAGRVLGAAGIETIYNAIDFDRFQATGPCLDLDAASQMTPPPRPVVRIGLVATYARWKGHDVFLRALGALPPDLPVRGYIVGGPVYRTGSSQWTRGELGELAASAGLDGRVGFTGFVDEAGAAYRSLDIVVHASTEPEPFGLVVAEAMACGRAVITTAQGGVAELIEPERDALVARGGDPSALALAILRLAADPALRQAIGMRAREAALQRFAPRRMALQLADLYEQIAQAHRSTSVISA